MNMLKKKQTFARVKLNKYLRRNYYWKKRADGEKESLNQ